MFRSWSACYALLLASGLLACARPSPETRSTPSELAAAESLYADLRDARDRIYVTLASGLNGIHDATPVVGGITAHNALRRAVAARLDGIDSSGLRDEDRRALAQMRRTLQSNLDSMTPPDADSSAGMLQSPSCNYDPRSVAGSSRGVDSLRARIYACYGWAQSHVLVDGQILDRLTILGELGRADAPNVRRRLFLSLDPVWRSMNGANQATSPYRVLIARQMAGATRPPSLEQASASGMPPDSLEPWLEAMLDTWRRATPDSSIQPWDWYYMAGAASRALSPRISRARLSQLNAAVYRSFGADVGQLRVRYDLEPREGKTPVAYTTFGARPRLMNGRWRAGQPWIFATYRTGGLDNLSELLHETGHAIHIAAIRTRPAFADWPDSDPFTEAVADIVALEVTEPAWQWRWLGDSVPLREGLRARYAGILIDVAWALFELRMQRDPSLDPNQVWTTLTRDYLRIQPHPELSWWAMRGQLVDAPGYMMNYAAGAMLIAAIRARTRELHGPFTAGDSSWYGWVAPRLFRFGLERPTREVIEDLLGGPVTPKAILEDMRR
ncbi:MAG: hypothetical protein ACJ8CN_13870 [Gemmatimonadales bacterium]